LWPKGEAVGSIALDAEKRELPVQLQAGGGA